MAIRFDPEHMRFLFVGLLEASLWIGLAVVLLYAARFFYCLGSALRSWLRGDDRLEITMIDAKGRAHRRVIVAACVAVGLTTAGIGADTVFNACYGIDPNSWAWILAGCWFL